jgi:hypothetical protein
MNQGGRRSRAPTSMYNTILNSNSRLLNIVMKNNKLNKNDAHW